MTVTAGFVARGEPGIEPGSRAMPAERMHVVVTGHVDHGKSTVIGRLLADTGSLPEGKIETVRSTCARNAKPFEYAFLIDALRDEQAQGITIDAARVFFKTERRHYVILDAPGHVEFLKNMISGASRADAALLVIDGQEGIRENSRRHGFMLSMLGISQIAVLVNKMDLVGYSQDVFDGVVEEYRGFLAKFGVIARWFIPVSALSGENLVSPTPRLGWYGGPTVLEALAEFEIRPPLTAAAFRSLCMLWSIGKDSTVLLWLARKAFFGHVPFPLIHIDTSFKIPEMIEYRDRLAAEWHLTLMFGQNADALADNRTYPGGAVDRIACCSLLKTEALKRTLSGEWPRYKYNHATARYERDQDTQPFTGVIVGARADEEGSRSKERYFSPRTSQSTWDVADQPPELWNQYKTDYAPGTHVRIHPLLDWTELNIWEYIGRERIPIVGLYFDRGTGTRYRSLGCGPCTRPIESTAASVDDVIVELRSGRCAKVAERSGRAQDEADGGGLETLRREGYM